MVVQFVKLVYRAFLPIFDDLVQVSVVAQHKTEV